MFKPFFMKAAKKTVNKEEQAKPKNKKYNYYAGRSGFRGAPSSYYNTTKSLAAVQAEYPHLKWEVSTKEAFDAWSLAQF